MTGELQQPRCATRDGHIMAAIGWFYRGWFRKMVWG
jgi:hypothetical protein